MSWQCKLLNQFLRWFVKPKFQRFAVTCTLAEQQEQIVKMRSLLKKIHWRLPDAIQEEAITVNEIPAYWVKEKTLSSQRTLLYVHGGGYTLGSVQLYRDLVYRLGLACQAKALAIDYRLAPEHSLSTIQGDVLQTYQWLLAQNIPAEEIILAGDSAGGGLVLSSLLKIRDQALPAPRCAVCFSPWTDLSGQSSSLESNAASDAYLVIPQNFAFLGAIDRKDPSYSPLYANLEKLSPILIQVGRQEVLFDDARRFAIKAQAANTHVELDIWEGVPHVWQFFAKYVPEGRQALARVGEFVANQFLKTNS